MMTAGGTAWPTLTVTQDKEGPLFFSLTKRSRSQQEDNRLKAEWAYQLQFIKDFLLSTPSLKIIHNSGTLSSPISLHRFGNLSSLHLRRVQIHMVEGLQKLRNILISLTVYRGLDKLKDVLECCGGDMSAPMTWPTLKFVSFTFNSLTNLDESLRLLPCVQKVDLSHNLIESCESFLENLVDVLYVTLAYNNLKKVPSFSPTSRSSLVSLILRGNNLDNLSGLEALLALQDLDLGENYLNDHCFLVPLGTLSKLKQLQLDGNPIYYHKSHRTLTVSYLSWKAVNCEFELDKRKLSASEVHHFSPQRKLAISSLQLPYENRASTLSGSEMNKITDYRFSPSSGIGSETDSTDVIAQPSSRKSKHRRIKPRKTVILDMDTSGDLSSSQGATPGTSPSVSGFKQQTSARSEEARKTKQQIEELREHYGPNWLQAIEDRNIFNKKKPVPVKTSTPMCDGDLDKNEVDYNRTSSGIVTQVDIEVLNCDETTDISPTDDDLYLRETKPVETNNPNMAAIARLAAGLTHSENDQTGNISPTAQTKSLPNDSWSSPSEPKSTLNGSSQPKLVRSVAVSDSEKVLSSQQKVKVDSLPLLAITYPAQPPSQSHYKKDNIIDIPSSALEHHQDKNSPALPVNKDGSHKVESTVNTSETKSDGSIQTLDSDELTEAIFAYLPDKDNKMIILSLASSTLIEKDITMKVIEKLDLTSLVSMECQTVKNRRRHVSAEGGGEKITEEEVEVMQLDLKFNYMRKDRQTRCYQVDKDDGNNLIRHLRPILDLKESEAKIRSMVVMQCLKCNRTFLKSELVHQRKSLPTAGSSKDLHSLQALMDSPTLICPKCGSTIIIELDSSASAAKSTSSATSTPVGSYNSTGSFIEQAKPSSTVKARNINLRPRKNSTSSLDLNLSKKLNLDAFTTTNVNSSSWTQDNLLKRAVVSSGRDRSNAFNVNSRMARSAVVHGSSFSEAEELICVEDYFTEETRSSTSQQLAAMTTSLRGDLSTKGKTADVRRNSLMALPDRKSEAVVAASDNRTGDDKNAFSLGGAEELRDGQLKSVTDGSTTIPSEVQSEGEKVAEPKVPLKVSEYKNLATMEDMVKALVCEGQNLLFQETLSSSVESRENIRTVSVSAFRKSSVTQRRDSGACNDKDSLSGLKLSDSSSSITILPTPAVLEAESTTLGTSISPLAEPVKFSIGTPYEDEDSPKNSMASAETRVVSPLNPDICSSMVSSVYLTSVTSPPGSDCDTMVDGQDDAVSSSIQSVPQDDSAPSFHNDEEDITSIYDSSWLSSRVEMKSRPDSAAPSKTMADDGAVPLSDDSYHGVNYASLAGYDTDSADDEDGTGTSEVHQNVVQYAFHHLNHHLTLYMMMSLFENDEEFRCKIQSEVVQYIIEDSYEGILVMSSCRFYVLKITSDDHSLPPDQWLNCIEIQPIPELRYVDVGLGGQSFRLEFVTDCSSYTFITRNKEKTLQFVELLHTNLAKYAVSQGISSHVIVNEDVDQPTLNNLTADVVCKLNADQRLLLYCMGFIERGNQKLFPVSFVITTCDICLVRANHQWPQPRLQAPISAETVGKQFTVLERQRINNVASVEVCETTMKKMRLELFNEMEGISVNWNITLLNRQTTVDFINALSEPWAKEFGVEMEISYAELDF